MPFYGRKDELARLNRLINNNNFQTALIYGRKRVGKTELIKESMRHTSAISIFYECKQASHENNVESLSRLVSKAFGFPRLMFDSIEDILDFVAKQAQTQNVILALDEYSHLKDVVKGLDSILQSIIDNYREESHLKLILCGSYVDIMKSLLQADNPLYGRLDLTINLKQMDYYESALFYPTFSDEDKVRLYSVFGGIPYYNRLINSQLSVKENIIELISSPGARLENEVEMYLKTEINKINNANEVLETMALGISRFKDILSKSHVSSSPTLVDVLKKLIGMEIVTYIAPINDLRNKRKAGYYIADNMSQFYYRYLSVNMSQRAIMAPDAFYDIYIEKDFEEKYVPKVFESICKQYLIRQNKAGKIVPPLELIGKYYYDLPAEKRNGEFDVVTYDQKGYVFYEAKFKSSPMTLNDITKEIDQVKKTGLETYAYGFFSRSGFEGVEGENIILYNLSDVYQ